MKQLKVGICADVHQDIINNGCERLSAFIDEMHREKPDFIIQLGDFCEAHERNKSFMDIWESFNGRSYHVIGNHELDMWTHAQCKRQVYAIKDVVSYYSMPGSYYSFDCNDWHCIVLFGSEQKPDAAWEKDPHYIGREQRLWLEADLKKTSLPTMIFCHQGIDRGGTIDEIYVRRILELANEDAGWKKVQFFFSGHHHNDYHNIINEIHYIQINSMSYQWLGRENRLECFMPDIYEKYPFLLHTVPYKDPLWAVMTIDDDGSVCIKGRKTEFLGPSSFDGDSAFQNGMYPTVPYISDREINWRKNE